MSACTPQDTMYRKERPYIASLAATGMCRTKLVQPITDVNVRPSDAANMLGCSLCGKLDCGPHASRTSA